MKRFPVIWLTGNSGAGKSTLAFGVRDILNEKLDTSHPLARRAVVLDGDEMRASISVDEGFSPEDRRKHNLRVARLADLLSQSGHLVIVAVIAPFSAAREEVRQICNPQWVYLKRSGRTTEDRPYEAPENPGLIIDNDIASIEEAQGILMNFIEENVMHPMLLMKK